MNYKQLFFGIAFLLLAVSVYVVLKKNADHQVSYNQRTRPIINTKCIASHGGFNKASEVSFLFRGEALDTAESGLPIIVPGDPKYSEVYQSIVHHDPEFRMLLEAEPLTQEEIDLIARWIDQGADFKGRDHHGDAFTMGMAGGRVNNGVTYGETDEIGFYGISGRAHVHDIQATILHQLELHLGQLIHQFQGKDFRLTGVAGNIIIDILAGPRVLDV